MAKYPGAAAIREGQESVWDYPRPPRLEPVNQRISVHFAGVTIADTTSAFRILETSHPPVYYLPPDDLRMDLLVPESGSSFCEFKGLASYISISQGSRHVERAGWRYEHPNSDYEDIAGFVAFYASKVDEAMVDGERVLAQQGDFYGGWITSRIVGPFKGAPGTLGW